MYIDLAKIFQKKTLMATTEGLVPQAHFFSPTADLFRGVHTHIPWRRTTPEDTQSYVWMFECACDDWSEDDRSRWDAEMTSRVKEDVFYAARWSVAPNTVWHGLIVLRTRVRQRLAQRRLAVDAVSEIQVHAPDFTQLRTRQGVDEHMKSVRANTLIVCVEWGNTVENLAPAAQHAAPVSKKRKEAVATLLTESEHPPSHSGDDTEELSRLRDSQLRESQRQELVAERERYNALRQERDVLYRDLEECRGAAATYHVEEHRLRGKLARARDTVQWHALKTAQSARKCSELEADCCAYRAEITRLLYIVRGGFHENVSADTLKTAMKADRDREARVDYEPPLAVVFPGLADDTSSPRSESDDSDEQEWSASIAPSSSSLTETRHAARFIEYGVLLRDYSARDDPMAKGVRKGFLSYCARVETGIAEPTIDSGGMINYNWSRMRAWNRFLNSKREAAVLDSEVHVGKTEAEKATNAFEKALRTALGRYTAMVFSGNITPPPGV